jgi:hypothetical protein
VGVFPFNAAVTGAQFHPVLGLEHLFVTSDTKRMCIPSGILARHLPAEALTNSELAKLVNAGLALLNYF